MSKECNKKIELKRPQYLVYVNSFGKLIYEDASKIVVCEGTGNGTPHSKIETPCLFGYGIYQPE